MGVSKYLARALLNHVYRGIAFSAPALVFVALYTNNPTNNDTGTEVQGSGYERLVIESTAGGWSAPETVVDNPQLPQLTREMIASVEQALWPVATAAWGTITHIALRDAATGGNLLHHGALKQPKTIGEGDRFSVEPGDLEADFM